MAEYIVNKEVLVDIADTIREKNNSSNKLTFPAGFNNNIKPSDIYNYLNKTITEFSNSDITNIRDYAFYKYTSLKSIDLPSVTSIGSHAFYSCNLKSITLPSDITIGPYAFYSCDALTSINLPLVTSIEQSAFGQCNSLTSVNLPLVEIIGSTAFQNCKSLETVNIPSAISIYSYAFQKCKKLQTITGSLIETIEQRAFEYCTALTSIDLSKVTEIGQYAFQNCTALTSIDLPSITSIESHAFYSCKSLTSVNLPSTTSLKESAFLNCTSLISIDLPSVTSIETSALGSLPLTSIDLPSVTSIGKYAFSNCNSLETIILRSETMCTLSNTNAFTNTPIANGTGYIYVPSALVDTYKTAANWSTYTNQFRAIEKSGISSIGNKIMIYNTTKNIEVNWYPSLENIDTVISNIQVTSGDETAVIISNIANADNTITFDINTLTTEGTYTITVSATIGEDEVTTSFDVIVYETLPEPTYTVEPVDGATYGFALNDSGYYESNNKGVNSSAAVCKLVFNSQGIYNMHLDCINSGESNYDYGTLSNIDTILTTSHSSEYSSNVFKSFKGLSSTEVQTVDYGILESGEHFIYIKFIKDSSSNSGNDTLQFKVRFELS